MAHMTFNGYLELMTDFWGFELSSEDIRSSEFWTGPIAMIAADEMDSDTSLTLMQHHGCNEVIQSVSVGGLDFDMMSLSAEGGFATFLVLARDIPELLLRDPTIIIFIE
jgi:hypothetical protein